MSVRIGVIGVGIMGADDVNPQHRFVRGATVVAVVDVALDRAEAAAEVGARSYDDAFALITDPDVDAVVIASHDGVHAEQVVEAVKAAKPVLSEKPLAPSLADARQVLRTIGTGGELLLSLGFMRRFDPGYVELRAAIESGRIGAPVLMHNVSWVSHPDRVPRPNPRSPVLLSTEFDVVAWLLRSPVEVSWLSSTPSAPACQYSVLQVRVTDVAESDGGSD
jgi:myo-inositol 2-dehydrogenase / D-chiro-inositol 1-dehydrogenase